MTATQARMYLSLRVFGLGVIALGMICLAFGDFLPGQPVPNDFPDRTALAHIVAILMIISGAAVLWRRTAAWGAAALTAYYALVVVVLMNGRVVLAHYAEYGSYERVAVQLAIALGALIIYAGSASYFDAQVHPVGAHVHQSAGRRIAGSCVLEPRDLEDAANCEGGGEHIEPDSGPSDTHVRLRPRDARHSPT